MGHISRICLTTSCSWRCSWKPPHTLSTLNTRKRKCAHRVVVRTANTDINIEGSATRRDRKFYTVTIDHIFVNIRLAVCVPLYEIRIQKLCDLESCWRCRGSRRRRQHRIVAVGQRSHKSAAEHKSTLRSVDVVHDAYRISVIELEGIRVISRQSAARDNGVVLKQVIPA